VLSEGRFECKGHTKSFHHMSCGDKKCEGHAKLQKEMTFHGDSKSDRFYLNPYHMKLETKRLHYRVNPCTNCNFLRITSKGLSEFRCLGHKVKETQRLVLVGETGTGKSTLGNSLVGNNSFFEHGGLDAGTVKAKVAEGISELGDPLKVVDTQGFNDPKGRDFEHAKQMLSVIRSLGTVNAFLLVVNGMQVRWGEQTKIVLGYIAETFPGFTHNLLVVITRLP